MDIPKTTPPRGEVPSLGVGNDLKNLKVHGATSLVELKEFLARLKGRNPQEVIGIVSTSKLIQSVLIALFATVAIMAIFTVGPYYVYGPPKGPAQKPQPPKPAAVAQEAPPSSDKSPPESAPPGATKSGDPAAANAAKAAKAMGLDETKNADPKSNPLEKNLDKLLDDVK